MSIEEDIRARARRMISANRSFRTRSIQPNDLEPRLPWTRRKLAGDE